MNDYSAYCYIQEQTSGPEDYKTEFGYTKHDRGSRFFLTFNAVLQSFDVMNRNRRMYQADNIMDRINNDDYVQSMLRQNSWVGEIDHPTPAFTGQELSMLRISNPNKEKSSHYIRSPKLVGNLLEAGIQTDSANEAGMNMAISIVDGKIVPCFSARVLGELSSRSGRPIVNVRKLITYDWVLYPSHQEALAKITQPIAESVKVIEEAIRSKIIFLKDLAQMAAHHSKEATFICEAFDLSIDDVIGVTETGNSVVMQEGKNIYVQPLTQVNIRAKTQNTVRNWLNS